jgi:hypothetical protein
MAAGIHRTIIVPYDNNFPVDEQGILTKVATLVGSLANVLTPNLGWQYIQFYQFVAGAWIFGTGIKLELLETVLGDAVVLANLPAFQTALGVSIATWSDSMTFGF